MSDAIGSGATTSKADPGPPPIAETTSPKPDDAATQQPDTTTSVPPPNPSPTPVPTLETPPGTASASVAEKADPAPTTVVVAGRVKDAQGNSLGNVVVVLISPQGTVLAATTDEQGNYSFTVAASSAARGYRLIPSKEGYVFEPADKILQITGADAKDADFVGSSGTKPS